MSTFYGPPGSAAEILAHHRAIEACIADGRIARIRGTFAEYDAASWAEFKAQELDRRINEKGLRALGTNAPRWRKLDSNWQTNARRDQRALQDFYGQRIRLPRRFNTPEVQTRLGHLLSSED